MRRTVTFSALAVATALAATPALAQVSTVPDTTNKFVRTLQFFGDQGPLVNTTLLVVPANRNFRVTDLIVYARGASNCLVIFSHKTAEFFVEDGDDGEIPVRQRADLRARRSGRAGQRRPPARCGGNDCTMTWTR